MPMLYGLAALRVFVPYWPVHAFYCQFPTDEGAIIKIRTDLLEYADLLAHHIAYLSTTGLLAAAWRVCLSPHLAGSGKTTFVIEPSDPQADVAVLASDLQRMGDALPRSIRGLARTRLACLGASATSATVGELSLRENEVLDLLLAGFGVATIAQQLFISPHTVRNHIKHICAKLDVTSQRALCELFALR